MTTLFDFTTGELRRFIPGLIANFTIKDALKAILNSTAERILVRFLGPALAEQVAQGNSADEPVFKQAFGLAQELVAKLGFADYLPFAEVQIGDDGITVTAAEGRRAAFDYQTKKIDKELREVGWQKLDELLRLIASRPDLFPDWATAPYNLEYDEALFSSAVDFSKSYSIQERWLTFWALRPFIQAVEDNQGVVAMARLDALPNTVTDSQKAPLKRNLLRALAHQAVIMALPQLSIEINGVNVHLNYTSQYGGVSTYYTPPGREMLDWVSGNLQKQADLFWGNFESGLLALSPPAEPEQDEYLGPIDDDGPFVMV